ncbi:MAG TPA: DUF3566 domain-containing protein [Nitriliruptorales bacterium]|nr:DUF3566 domain-containing protein [Nitriliruptorales bacterium]
MARRKLILRRIDPWTVLKFGSVLNVCLLAIGLLGFGVLWFAISQLGVVEQFCQLATDVGFQECGINGGNLFRYLLLLGILGVVIQTGLMVFLAFLHNLIADLVGGLSVTLQDEGAPAGPVRAGVASGRPAEQSPSPGRRPAVGPAAGPARTAPTPAGATGGTASAGGTGSAGGTPAPGRATPRTSPQSQRAPRDRPGSTARTGGADEGVGRWPWERVKDARRESRAEPQGSRVQPSADGPGRGEAGGGASRVSGASRAAESGVQWSGDGPAPGEGASETQRSDESLFGRRGDA